MSAIKLYGYSTSPFVRKVGAFLYYKQLDFDFVPVNPVNPSETIGFTAGTQVPVLSIGENWKTDSTPIGEWLDAVYPERPLLPDNPDMLDTIMTIDGWINTMFFPSFFRAAIDAPDSVKFRSYAWRLAAIVSASTPLPEIVRHKWPDFLRAAPFIQRMADSVDRTEDITAMQARLGMELYGHLRDGPYLGGSDGPTLIDFAIVPQMIFPYMTGLQDHIPAFAVPALKDWIIRTAQHLPKNPTLVPDAFVLRHLPDHP